MDIKNTLEEAKARIASGCRTLDRLHVPGTGQGQRDGKDGLIAVDHVHPEQQRNAEAAFLHRDFLDFADRGSAL